MEHTLQLVPDASAAYTVLNWASAARVGSQVCQTSSPGRDTACMYVPVFRQALRLWVHYRTEIFGEERSVRLSREGCATAQLHGAIWPQIRS